MGDNNLKPPRVFLRFFRWFCHPKLRDSIEGDLMELHNERIKTEGKRKADLKFIVDVLLLFRRGIVKQLNVRMQTNNYMLRNYLKIGLRNLTKSKLFSSINIGGMAISMASVFLIALFIHDELQFDKHVESYTRKYRVYTEGFADDGSLRKRAMVPPMIAPTAASEFPEVESYARFLNLNYPVLFKANNKKLSEKAGGYADPTVFEMFSLKLIEGNPATALVEPNSIAISRSLKLKYFGDQPAIGEVIQVNDVNEKITAVFEDFSEHSHLKLNFFMAMSEFAQGQEKRMQRWSWNQFHTYMSLKPGTNAAQLEEKMSKMVKDHTPDENRKLFLPKLMPIEKIHLFGYDHLWDIAVRGNIQTVYILSATALFIIVIAILNFVNLSTARALNRVKEVGIRKVVGAFRTHLIGQFISESVLISLLAFMIGGSLTLLTLPSLNAFTEKNISLNLLANPTAVVAILAFAFLTGIAAGVYPAFYVSGHSPSQILWQKSTGRSGKSVLRNGLVVFQFVLSFFLVIASSIVSDQHTYMRTAKMGFDKDNLIVIQLRGNMEKNLEATKRQFLDHPNIISGSMGYGLPGEAFAGDGIVDKVTHKEIGISMLTVDHDYIKTLGLEIVAGRDFSKDILSDEKHAFIVSEAGAKMLGHVNAKEALEHPVAWNRWDAPDSLKDGKVIGVVKDIQLNSMRETINPVVLHIVPFAYSTLTMKIKKEDIPSTISHLEKTWKSFNIDWPFEYRFLDENFDQMYKSEEKLAKLFSWVTTFTIFVACLGLFGLVVYSTSQKYKEISIRKVLGAGEGSLVVQLGKSYVLLIAVSFFIAMPLSYYAANQWLQRFAFHISVAPVMFVKASLLIVAISIITVGLQSFKAARANPADALKEQ